MIAEKKMKKFKMEHLFFDDTEIFTEDDVPWWLISRAFYWFYENHVMTLEIDESVETDFRRITRIE